ncbi:MAG: hypothetical protein K2M97_05610 [Muribaculaceae bacterium]|nr:hypothetical protein [Muribaculaceae bacterium]
MTLAQAKNCEADTARLNRAYRQLMANAESADAQRAFFDAFPDRWQAYYNVYSLDPKLGPEANLHNEVEQYVEALRLLMTQIDDSTYCDKLINVATWGVYRGDKASGALKTAINEATEGERGEIMLRMIPTMITGNQVLFWQFYWSGIWPGESGRRRCEELKTRMTSAGFVHEAELMEQAYDNFHGVTL